MSIRNHIVLPALLVASVLTAACTSAHGPSSRSSRAADAPAPEVVVPSVDQAAPHWPQGIENGEQLTALFLDVASLAGSIAQGNVVAVIREAFGVAQTLWTHALSVIHQADKVRLGVCLSGIRDAMLPLANHCQAQTNLRVNHQRVRSELTTALSGLSGPGPQSGITVGYAATIGRVCDVRQDLQQAPQNYCQAIPFTPAPPPATGTLTASLIAAGGPPENRDFDKILHINALGHPSVADDLLLIQDLVMEPGANRIFFMTFAPTAHRLVGWQDVDDGANGTCPCAQQGPRCEFVVHRDAQNVLRLGGQGGEALAMETGTYRVKCKAQLERTTSAPSPASPSPAPEPAPSPGVEADAATVADAPGAETATDLP